MSDRVEYFNSLKGMADKKKKQKIELVYQFLVEINRIRKNFELEYVSDRLFQLKGYDYGMFAMQVASCIIYNKPFDFCQPIMPRLRVETAAFILEKRSLAIMSIDARTYSQN